MNERAEETLTLYTYTRAHRLPLVISRIAGWTIPPPLGPISIAQLAVLVGSVWVMVQTRGLWAHASGTVNLMLLIGVPCVLAFTFRKAQIEGRGPVAVLLGIAALLSAPRAGRHPARLMRQQRARRVGPAQLLVAAGPSPNVQSPAPAPKTAAPALRAPLPVLPAQRSSELPTRRPSPAPRRPGGVRRAPSPTPPPATETPRAGVVRSAPTQSRAAGLAAPRQASQALSVAELAAAAAALRAGAFRAPTEETR